MKPAPLRHYLITFDIDLQVAAVREFGEDYGAALAAYTAAEIAHGDEARTEVVLLGADSLETLKSTHSSYFMGAQAEHPFAAHLRLTSASRG